MISIDDLETFLGIADGTDTELLIDIEGAAVEWFEQQTQRFFGAVASVTERPVGNGKRDLYLSEPITAVTSVTRQAYPGADTETITEGDDDGFEIRDMHLTRKGGYVWTSGYEYIVVFTRGYTLTAAAVADTTPADIAAPDDVRMAIKQIVSFWYNAGDPADGSSQKTSETMGNYSYTRGALFTTPEAMLNGIPGLRETIAAYRIPRF